MTVIPYLLLVQSLIFFSAIILQVCVVQESPTQLSVDVFSADNHLEFRADIQVRGVHNTVDHLLIWNMKKMVIYEITSDATHLRVVG